MNKLKNLVPVLACFAVVLALSSGCEDTHDVYYGTADLSESAYSVPAFNDGTTASAAIATCRSTDAPPPRTVVLDASRVDGQDPEDLWTEEQPNGDLWVLFHLGPRVFVPPDGQETCRVDDLYLLQIPKADR